MFGKGKTLFKLFGIPVKANLSWLFLVGLILVTWAMAVFPDPRFLGEGKPQYVYWGLAAIATAGLFASLIVHELCHSLVARKAGMPVSGITLFIFGGVSQLEDEPPTAGTEFLMAVVGPLASVIIGAGLLAGFAGAQAAEWPKPVQVLFQWLGYINLLLAAFNSLPAFPLDGGRVLRSAIWFFSGDLQIATRVAVNIGSGIGMMMIFGGLVVFLFGGAIGALWLVVIGFFLRQAALSNLQMVMMREYLEGETVDRFMTTDLVTANADMDLQQFVDEYVFHHRFTYYPVVNGEGRLKGIVSARDVRDVPNQQWPERTVNDIMREVSEETVMSPDTDAVEALSTLRHLDEGRVVVVEDEKPVGIVSLRDLMGFLALKIDLEPRRVKALQE